MENIYNNYRNIVERAVFAGIITEEQKNLYLSAIDEETDSDFSDLEMNLMKDEVKHLNVYSTVNFDSYSLPKSDRKNEHFTKKIMQHQRNSGNVFEDKESVLSGDTIENYSIFDIKNQNNNKHSMQASASDTSLTKSKVKTYALSHKYVSTGVIPKTSGKPHKNQVIDFNVPIYIDINRKKASVDPEFSDVLNLEHQKYNLLNSHCYKSKRSKFANGAKQKNKWTLVLPALEDTKKYIPSSICKNSNFDFLNMPKHGKHQFSETNANTQMESNVLLERKRDSILRETQQCCQNRNTKPGRDYSHCNKQIHVTDKLRKFRFRNNALKEEENIGINLIQPSNRFSHCQNQDDATNITTHLTSIGEESEKNESYKHICTHKNTYNVSDTSTEAITENDSFISDTPPTKHPRQKERDKLLNVNIFCQFYQNDEKGETNDIRSRIDEFNDKPRKGTGKSKKERTKASPGKTIQQLSKLFTNMKINKKARKL